MKKIIFIISAFALFLFSACEKDNYDAPNATLYGTVVYNNDPVYLKNAEVTFRIYEPGWELSASTYMDVFIAQDGTYSASLFSGKTYKLIRTANIGPWQNPTVSDTITIKLSGDTKQDIQVTPYFTIPSSSISISGGVATATFSINEIVPGSVVDKVGLYVASNIIVDAINNKSSVEMSGASIDNMGNVVLSVNLTDALKKESYVFARVGVKSTMSDHLIYTPVIKIDVN